MLRMVQIIFLALFAGIFTIPSYAKNDSTPMIAAGTYDMGYSVTPLILTSVDKGHHWSWLREIDGHSIEKETSILRAVNCNESFCIAAPLTHNPNTFQLLASFNQGKTWQSAPGLAELNFMFTVSAMNCLSDKCFMIGMNLSREDMGAFIAESNKLGTEWRLTKQIVGLPDVNINLSKVSCSATHCIIIGYLEDNHVNKPLILIKSTQEDKQESQWQYIANVKGLDQSGTMMLDQLHCNADQCLAAGIKRIYKNELLLISSKDGGRHWEAPNYINQPAMQNQEILSISCEKDRCIAVGHYAKNEERTLPLILIDQQNTITFNQKIANLPIDFAGGRLTQISCSQNICLAAGIYDNGQKERLLLLLSEDKGENWRALDHIQALQAKDIIITSIHCSNDICVAGGCSAYNLPAIVVSYDAGKTWALIDQFVNAPKTIKSAIIFSIGQASKDVANESKLSKLKLKPKAKH